MWGAYQGRRWFHRLGTLEVSPEGWPLWHTPVGQVSLCQFSDTTATGNARRRTGPGTRSCACEVDLCAIVPSVVLAFWNPIHKGGGGRAKAVLERPTTVGGGGSPPPGSPPLPLLPRTLRSNKQQQPQKFCSGAFGTRYH